MKQLLTGFILMLSFSAFSQNNVVINQYGVLKSDSAINSRVDSCSTAIQAGSGWGLTGNTGTDPNTNFIGTTDAVDLALKSNNKIGIKIKAIAGRFYPSIEISGGVATGTSSTAMTNGNANGAASTAMSNGTANGDYSTATGLGVTAQSFSETAIGIYNTTYTPALDSTDRIFSVGIGTSIGRTIYPKNALTILKNGNVGIGTSTPTAKLHVDGDVKATSDIEITDYTKGIILTTQDGTRAKVTLKKDSLGNLSLEISNPL